MTCPTEETLLDYVNGLLPQPMEQSVEQHIDACPGCRFIIVQLIKFHQPEKGSLSLATSVGSMPFDLSQLQPSLNHYRGQWKSRLAPGSMVDHFRIIRLLGHGGMSEVYVARDTRLGRKVALKLIHPAAMGSDEEKQRFLFEAQTTARFSHPHIVTIYHVGEHQGFPYLALEYLDGETLRARLSHERLSIKECLRIGLAIALALRESHGNQVLHRDLKPENIFIPKDGRLRVLDFGLAKFAPEHSSRPQSGLVDNSEPNQSSKGLAHHTQGKGLRGTPAYMSPEQWRDGQSSAASDIWALGIILYELFSGHHPYPAMDTAQCKSLILNQEQIPRLSNIQMPTEMVDLVQNCLAKESEQRPSADQVVQTLERILSPGSPLYLTADENPFRGLMPFTEKDAGLFFGRDHDLATFLERLREHAVLPVIGPSGVGKSSFVQAGVIPWLKEEGRWTVLQMRPGRKPLQSLISRISRGESRKLEYAKYDWPENVSPEMTGLAMESLQQVEESIRHPFSDLVSELGEHPEVLNLILYRLAEVTHSQVLLVVDQLEEVFTLVEDLMVRQAFLRAILTAADDAQDPVRVIFTLREDFIGPLARLEEGRESLGHVTMLGLPDISALEQTLIRPVKLMRYEYDDPLLVTEMVQSVRDEAMGLPLLEFAAARLWEHRDQQRQRLLRAAYDTMGGVAGALAQHADGVLKTFSPEHLRAAHDILLRLVTPERTRNVITSHDALEGLGPEAGDVLEQLTQSRLVAVRKIEREGVMEVELELAHESLIKTWSQLARWIDESQAEIRMLAEVRQAAEFWNKRNRPEEEVWQGEELHEAKRILGLSVTPLPELVNEFLNAGQVRERRKLYRKRVFWGTGIALLLLLSVGLLLINVIIAEQRQQARRRWAEAQRESARADYIQDNIWEARAKLRGSLEVQDSIAGRALWWQISHNPLQWQKKFNDKINIMAFSPDGHKLAIPTSGGQVHILELPSLHVRILRGYADQTSKTVFSPDGKLLAVSDFAGFIYLHNLTNNQVIKINCGKNNWALYAMAFTPDGRLLISGHADGYIRLWKTRTGQLQKIIKGHNLTVISLSISPNGRVLASGSADTNIYLWDIATGQLLKTLKGHNSIILGLSFSQDGQTLYSASDNHLKAWEVNSGAERVNLRRVISVSKGIDFHMPSNRFAYVNNNTIRVLNLSNGTEYHTLNLKTAGAVFLAFSPTGESLIVGGDDKKIQLIKLGNSPESTSYLGPTEVLKAIAISSDGTTIATGGADHSIFLWDTKTGKLQNVIGPLNSVIEDLHFSPDGQWLAVANYANLVTIWDIAAKKIIRTFQASNDLALSVSFSPDGKYLATGGEGPIIRIWNIVAGTLAKELRPAKIWDLETYSVSFDPAGKRLVSGHPAGYIYLWDIDSGKELRVLKEHNRLVSNVVFTPDGRHLISGSEDRTVRLWDLASGNQRVLLNMTHRISRFELDLTGKKLGIPTSSGEAYIWDLISNQQLPLTGHRDEVNELKFTLDGKYAVTISDDMTVRKWEVETGKPVWRAPLMRLSPPEIFTHQGWINLDASPNNIGQPPTAALPPLETSAKQWRKAVAERARLASEDFRSHLLCLSTYGKDLELWDSLSDKLLLKQSMPGIKQVQAVAEGCLIHVQGHVKLVLLDGKERLLAQEARAINASSSDIFVVTEKQIKIFDHSGKERGAYPVAATATAVLRMKSWLAVGYQDGDFALLPLNTREPIPAFTFEETPRSSVQKIIDGPRGTLIAGYANGMVGIWNTENGARLTTLQLHGPVIHLQRRGTKLDVGTELGDYRVMDLSAFYLNYCELIHQIWRKITVVWENGVPVARPPSRNHPCYDSYHP